MNDFEYLEMLQKDIKETYETKEAIKKWGKCQECNKPSSLAGKLYWYNGKLYCKNCLINKLLQDKIIYDNWFTNK